MNRGFLIVAQNTSNTDYIQCAKVLAKNLKDKMPTESVSLLTGQNIKDPIFDNVIIFPYGDQAVDSNWKLINDWQVYESSPYDFTIKLEADMYIPRRIDHWWDILKNRDLNICTTIRNFKSEISNVTFYRQTIIKNKLPNTYNAITYFKRSAFAEEFFKIVRIIFENWDLYKVELDYCPDLHPTTDVVYSIAAHIVGETNCVNSKFTDFSFAHMKPMINDLMGKSWTNELVYEIMPDVFRINSYTQLYPIHYHIKDFSKIIWRSLYE